jgi:hypothetical protein
VVANCRFVQTDTEQNYYQKWYEENGTGLNERRRDRYATDKAYRETVLERNSESRRRQRRQLIEEKRAKAAAKKLKTDGSWKVHTFIEKIDGREVEVTYFTIGALAKILGKGISTVRVWEKQGVFPETPHRSPKGDRIYTLEQVQSIRNNLRKVGRVESASNLKKKSNVPEPVIRLVRYDDGSTREVKLYQIGTLSAIVGKTVVWLKMLEKKRRLPKTPLVKSSLKHRLYTVEMIDVVRAAFATHGLHLRGNDLEWKLFRETVLDGWSRLGVEHAQVVEVDDENESDQPGGNSVGRGASGDDLRTERVA